jgi:hypothetical protein
LVPILQFYWRKPIKTDRIIQIKYEDETGVNFDDFEPNSVYLTRSAINAESIPQNCRKSTGLTKKSSFAIIEMGDPPEYQE